MELRDSAGIHIVENHLDNDFQIEFDIYLGEKDFDGADGITFVIHSDVRGFNAFGLTLLVISLATVLGAMALLPRLPRDTERKNPSWTKVLLGYGEILRRPVIVVLGLLRFLPTCYYGMATVLNPLLINRMAGSETARRGVHDLVVG